MKKYILILIKLAVASLIVYWIFNDIDFNKIKNILLNANLTYIFWALFIYFLVFVFFAIRWNIFNKIYSISMRSTDLLKHYLIAFFFNNFLVSSIGGDFWRIKKIYDVCQLKGKSFFIPLLERLTGFFAVVLICPLSFYIFYEKVNAEELKIASYILIILFFLITVFLFSKLTFLILRKLKTMLKKEKIQEFISTLTDILNIVQENKVNFLIGVLISVLTQIIFAISAYILCISLNVQIGFTVMLAIIPMTYIVSMLPISINGLGVKESFITWSLTQFFIDKNLAAAVALLISVKHLTISIIGGILFLINKRA